MLCKLQRSYTLFLSKLLSVQIKHFLSSEPQALPIFQCHHDVKGAVLSLHIDSAESAQRDTFYHLAHFQRNKTAKKCNSRRNLSENAFFLHVLDLMSNLFKKLKCLPDFNPPTLQTQFKLGRIISKCTQEYFDYGQDAGQMIVKENNTLFRHLILNSFLL